MSNSKRSITSILTTIILLGGIFAGIAYILNKNKAENKAITDEVAKTNALVSVRVDTAVMRSLDGSYNANGTFMPKQEVTVGAETGGRVIRVLVDEGDYVKAGQTLAYVEGDRLNVNVATAEANYNTAKADLERFEKALKTGGVTQQQVDQVRLQFESAKNNLTNSKISAGQVAIKTSVGGIVNSRKIEPGSYVNVGAPTFEIVNVSALKLKVNVDEKNVADLKVGQMVDIKVSVFPETPFKGKVTFISPKSNSSLNFPIEIEMNNANNKVRAGMYGTASFGKGKTINALVVPRTAFIGSVSDNKIFVIKDGKAVSTQVQSGRVYGDYVEVLGGLNTGDIVVTSGQINLFENTPVQIIK